MLYSMNLGSIKHYYWFGFAAFNKVSGILVFSGGEPHINYDCEDAPGWVKKELENLLLEDLEDYYEG